MQSRTPFYRRARIVGANNILNAVFMVAATVLCGVLLKMGFTVKGLYALCGLANLVVVAYLVITLPQTLFQTVARFLMRLFYRVEVRGMEHYEAAGNKALIVPNHSSHLDGPLLSCFLPERAALCDGPAHRQILVGEARLFPLLPGHHRSAQSADPTRIGEPAEAPPEGGDLPGRAPDHHRRPDENLRSAHHTGQPGRRQGAAAAH